MFCALGAILSCFVLTAPSAVSRYSMKLGESACLAIKVARASLDPRKVERESFETSYSNSEPSAIFDLSESRLEQKKNSIATTWHPCNTNIRMNCFSYPPNTHDRFPSHSQHRRADALRTNTHTINCLIKRLPIIQTAMFGIRILTISHILTNSEQ